MKRFRKTLSLLLALILCLSLLPVVASADEAGHRHMHNTAESVTRQAAGATSFSAYTVSAAGTKVPVPQQFTSFGGVRMDVPETGVGGSNFTAASNVSTETVQEYTATELSNGSIILDQPMPGPTLWSSVIERISSDAMRIISLISPGKEGALDYDMLLRFNNITGDVNLKAYDPSENPNGWLVIDTVNVADNNSWTQVGDKFQYDRTVTDSYFFLGYGNITTNLTYQVGFIENHPVKVTDANNMSTSLYWESEVGNVIVISVPEEGTGAVVYNETAKLLNATGSGGGATNGTTEEAVTQYSVVVTYTVPEGYTAPAAVKEWHKDGESYSVPSPTIDGLTPSMTAFSGVISGTDASATVTYTKQEVTQPAHVHEYKPEVVTAATCTADAVIQMKCSCGEVDPNGRTAPAAGDPAEWFAHHTWGTDYQSDVFYHWTSCTVCGVTSEKVSHNCSITSVVQEPTCTDGGSVNAVCDTCKRTMLLQANLTTDLEMCPGLAAYKALGHDFTGPVTWFGGPKVCSSEGQGTHAATCTRCGIHDDNTSPHSWTGMHTVSNGSCNDPNDPVIIEANCSECEATLHIEKPREHVPVLDNSQDVEPTCTEPGKRNGHRCTICGTFYDFEFVEPLGHDWVEDDRKDATCENEGYVHFTCSRCKEEKTEILPCRTEDRKHHWTLNIVNAASCLGMGSYDGDICTVCGAKTHDFHGEGYIDELGHKVTSVTTKIGRVRNKVSASGTPMEITCYRIDYVCGRCKARLGTEYYTVAVATASVIGHGSFQIEPGKDVNITDMKNGIHVNGNMADDGGVYFNGSVMDGLSEVVEQGGKKYEYRKVPANSFIIEFSDWFLNSQKDGEYTLEIINGNEYWPMVIVIENHKIVDIKPIEEPELPELSDEQYEAWLKEAEDAGVEVKELGLGCPDRG